MFDTSGSMGPQPEFKWQSADGRIMRPVDIADDHLINIIRFIWNHVATIYGHPTIPPANQIHSDWLFRAARFPAEVKQELQIMLEEYHARHGRALEGEETVCYSKHRTVN